MTGKLGPKMFPSSKIQTVASSHFLMLICHQAQYQKHLIKSSVAFGPKITHLPQFQYIMNFL